jgi:hypothetical protein
MELFSEIFIYSDQPTTCPCCQSRSEIILDLAHTIYQTQIHICMNVIFKHEFVVVNDLDFNNQLR